MPSSPELDARALRGLAASLLVWGCATPAEVPNLASHELVLLEELGPPRFDVMQLEAGEVDVSFQVPSLGFAYELDVDRHTGDIVAAYTEPPADLAGLFDRIGIFRIGPDGPTRLACEDRRGVVCSYPEWTEDRVWFIETDTGVAGTLSGRSIPKNAAS